MALKAFSWEGYDQSSGIFNRTAKSFITSECGQQVQRSWLVGSKEWFNGYNLCMQFLSIYFVIAPASFTFAVP